MTIQYDEKVQTILDSIPNLIILINGQDISLCNKAFLDFFGSPSLAAFKQDHQELQELFLSHPDHFDPESLDDGTAWTDFLYLGSDRRGTVSMSALDGKTHSFEVALKHLEEQQEYIITFTDITALMDEKKLYEYYAYHDALTGIYNRQRFDELLVKAVEDQKRYGDHLSLILFDIDYFKRINDEHGHQIGDEVLKNIPTVIGDALRTNDIFARWGGEEFIILLPRTKVEDAAVKAEELRQRIEELKVEGLPKITISLGVTEIKMSDGMWSCFQRVDKALYKAKVRRNDVVKVL